MIPEPKLAELMPRGLETLGVVELVVELPRGLELLEVAVPEELVSGGPHGFGSGSRFSVLEGWAPEPSVFPPKAEKGLFPNCTNRRRRKIPTSVIFIQQTNIEQNYSTKLTKLLLILQNTIFPY